MKIFSTTTNVLLGASLLLAACRSEQVDQTTAAMPRSEVPLEIVISEGRFAVNWAPEVDSARKGDRPALPRLLQENPLVLKATTLADELGPIEQAGGRVQRFCLEFMIACQESLGKLTLQYPDLSDCQCYCCWDPTIGQSGAITAGVDCEPPYHCGGVVQTGGYLRQLAFLLERECGPTDSS